MTANGDTSRERPHADSVRCTDVAKPQPVVAEGTDVTRMMALSDGLFAIVLTLLVLDLKPAGTVSGGLTYQALVQLWPRLFAFFLTFLVGGSIWMAHHADLDTLRGYDRTCLWLNLMFLLAVSLLPFTTGLIGEDTNLTSWSLYALNMVSIGVTQTALWRYATLRGLLPPDPDPIKRRFDMARSLTTPGIFALSIPVAVVRPDIAPFAAVLIPVAIRIAAISTGWRGPAAPPLSRGAETWRLIGFLPVMIFAVWSFWLAVNGQL